MPFNWTKALQYIIPAGATVGAAIIGSRAARRAGEAQAQASEGALELQREQFEYGKRLLEPYAQTGAYSLRQLRRGLGQPPGPAIDFSGGSTRAGSTSGDLSSALLAGDATLRPAGSLGKTVGRAASGAGTGAAIGSAIFPGIGTAIGAGVGALAGGVSGLIGRGRKEADQIVPYQNALGAEISRIEADLESRAQAGSLTQQDFDQATATVTQLRDQFYGLTQNFGRAGPGARQQIGSLVDPLLGHWAKGQRRPVQGRRHGGPVSGTGEYIVGEDGPEVLRMNRGDGTVIPLRELSLRRLRGMTPRQAGGPVTAKLDEFGGIREGEFLEPWEQKFRFDPNDITSDPGYQFRLNEGMKAVERLASARGSSGGGRTAKELLRYGQDYASGEFDRAYGRRFGEFGTDYNIFEANQAKRYNRIAAAGGSGQVAANQLNYYGAGYGRTAGDLATDAARARASGWIGGANAWIDLLSGGANAASRGLYNP